MGFIFEMSFSDMLNDVKAVIWLLSTGLVLTTSQAQLIRSSDFNLEEQIDSYLLTYVEMKDFSGSVLIARNNAVLYLGSFGYSNIEKGKKHDPYTIFPIHHLSHHFIASAIFVLEKEGMLNVDLPLSKIIPHLHPLGHRIKIKDLLNHKSGIPDYWYSTNREFINQPPKTISEVIHWIQNEPLEFIPGTDKVYSHSNYVVLAAIIQQLTGSTYSAYIQKTLFGPLNMQQSGDLINKPPAGNHILGYNPATGPLNLSPLSYYNRFLLPGSTSLYSSISDLFIWHKAMIHFQLFNPSVYPHGWTNSIRFNRKWYYQSGLAPGYAAHHSFYPTEQISIIVLSNIQSKVVEKIAHDLSAMLFNVPYDFPTSRIISPLLPEELMEYEGKYLIDNEDFFIVKQQNMDLLMKDARGLWMPLESIAKDTFFHKQQYVDIVFKRQQITRKVKSLVWDGYYECPKIR